MSEELVKRGWLGKSIFWVFRNSLKPLYGRGIGVRFPLAGKVYWFFYRLFSVGLRDRIILVEIEAIKFYMNSKSTFSLGLIINSTYEKGETRLLKGLIKEGMFVLDIGANVGYYSLIAARLVGEKGAVFAFEPAPDNFALLLKNIKVNGFSNITPVPKAVSNKMGSGRLFLSNEPMAHSIMYKPTGKGSVEVEVTTIDEFIENINRPVDLVKMDVEGSEMKALEGMLETIRINPTLKIITEFYPDNLEKSGCSPEAFLEKLMNCGFKLYIIDEETGVLKLADVGSIMKACPQGWLLNLYCARESLPVTFSP